MKGSWCTLVAVEDFDLRKRCDVRDVESLFGERLNGGIVVHRLNREKVTEEPKLGSSESVDSVLFVFLTVIC